ncbi:unnamed protein product [Debaryomyces tyrocola]|nr:unnamed protein product [Debaryomyces tyrocola]
MPCMYFSGVDSSDITIDDPSKRRIIINPELYDRVRNNEEENTRVFLDTHLLKIRGNEGQERRAEKLVSKGNASVGLGNMPSISILVYTSRALITAEFREMSSDDFKDRYLALLDSAIRGSNISIPLLAQAYAYPLGDAMHVEQAIQEYFDREIARTIDHLYHDIVDVTNRFCSPSFVRPPLDSKRRVQPDIIHMLTKSNLNTQYPELVFGVGDYKTGIYKMMQGFEEFKAAIRNRRRLRLNSIENFFPDREWSPRVLFALLLSKYIYEAFLCGTDRIFISDHQTFSGFFEYEIVDGEMIIDYYIINDPETVKDGITLRSAIAGFFYRSVGDAADTMARLMEIFSVASNVETKSIKELDPFFNVRPRDPSGSSKELAGHGFSGSLDPVKENDDSDNFDAIDGNTYCRVIYDSAEFYPDLKLPSPVFVKLYYYSSRLWEKNSFMYLEIPEKEGYYGMFFNELLINERIAKSEFASNFPKLFVSGYWNGLSDHPMHIFEYLGKEVPEEKWNKKEVYRVIKSRLEELHLIGISHNDVRPANIHVSVSGKISLIDFGLSDCTNNEEHKKNDLETLDYILRPNASNESENEVMFADRADEDDKYGNGSNSSGEEIFDEGSSETYGTRTTVEYVASKSQR